MRDVQVLVVGRGPAALLTALGLAQKGVDVGVLPGENGATDPPPAFCHWTVLPGLARLGVLDDVTSEGLLERRWSFKVLRTGEEIAFDLAHLTGDTANPYNVHINGTALREILLAHLARQSNVQVEGGTQVTAVEQTAGGVSVAVLRPDSEDTIRTSWVVGADGVRSRVRRSVGLGFVGLTWPERWVSLDVPVDMANHSYDFTAYQVDSRHGAVVRRLPETNAWRYTYTEPSTAPEESLHERAREWLRTVLGDAVSEGLVVASTGRMHERAAPTFMIGRVVLAGQAARVANPLTAFSTTGEFLDAFMLADALAKVVDSGDDGRLLAGYAESRRRTFLEFTAPSSADRKHLVFQIDDPEKLEAELEPYRQAMATPATQRTFLLSELEPDD